MRDRTVHTTIDQERCTGCALCVTVCPSETISLVEGKAKVTGDRSLGCDHCAAVCPAGAINVGSVDREEMVFETLDQDGRWLPHGRFDTSQLVRLMRSRRSCRNYTEKEVDRRILEDLVKIGTTAPSGSNSQLWTFTILSTRESVLALARRIGEFFRRLNRMAEKKYLRLLLKLLGRPQLESYYREHYESVERGLRDWQAGGRERLFHGAPALILVGAKPGASCPCEDALLASQNILLAAHSMGLGTCLIGFAVEAFRNDPSLKDFLGIPREEAIYSVIAIGYPDEQYRNLCGRKKVVPRHVEI